MPDYSQITKVLPALLFAHAYGEKNMPGVLGASLRQGRQEILL